MSLNFIETLLDKLYPRDNGNPLLKNWTGSQNLIGSNVSFNDSILFKYQEALLEANGSCSTNLPIKRPSLESTMFPFHHCISPNSLVSRVSKYFFPTALAFQDYSRISQEINTNQKITVNKVNYPGVNIWEELMEALNLFINLSKHSSNFDCNQNTYSSMKQSIEKTDFSDSISTISTDSEVNKVPGMAIEYSLESSPLLKIENPIEPEETIKVLASSNCTPGKVKKVSESDMFVLTVHGSSIVPKNKKLTTDNVTLNQEMANRKTKELQKRSRNRRRRQKRSKKNVPKSSLSVGKDKILSDVDSAVVSRIDCGLLNNIQNSATTSSAMCNVINIIDNSNSVQIILPNVSSFLITVDSAGDDSDWDENSDCEWLNDSSEFEFCSLNLANLPSSKLNTSLLSVPPCQNEDVETLQLNKLLQRVNKEWNEATKDLDGKLRSTTKVSFVPEDELVEVLPVGNYERKGEWETYALERLRFKRRIDELDKIISPCLAKEHRENFLQKYAAEL